MLLIVLKFNGFNCCHLLQIIDPLPLMDHSQVQYPEFTKNFYEEHDEIANMTPDRMLELRKSLGVHVSTRSY